MKVIAEAVAWGSPDASGERWESRFKTPFQTRPEGNHHANASLACVEPIACDQLRVCPTTLIPRAFRLSVPILSKSYVEAFVAAVARGFDDPSVWVRRAVSEGRSLDDVLQRDAQNAVKALAPFWASGVVFEGNVVRDDRPDGSQVPTRKIARSVLAGRS